MKPARLASIVLIAALFVVAVAPAAEILYALSYYINPNLLVLDPTTGAVLDSDPITNEQALFGGLAVDWVGDLYSIDGYNDDKSDRLFRINRADGAGTVVGTTGFNWNFRSVCAHPVTDVLYGMTDNHLYTLDRITGAGTSIAPIAGSTLDQATTLVIDQSGNAFITDIGDVGLFALDLVTGQATLIGNLSPGSSSYYSDLAYNAAGLLHGVKDSGGVYTIDTSAATETFKFGGTFKGLAFYSPYVQGDPNCDGLVNAFDIDPFILALTDPAGYLAAFPDCDILTADCNGDGSVNAFDIDPFIELLTGP